MIYKKIPLQILYEKFDCLHDGYQPYIKCYIHDQTNMIKLPSERPALILCPGGAYAFKSDREEEPVALRYLSAGMNVFVLQYSVAPNQYPSQFLELAMTVRLIRENAKEWNIDPHRIIVCGFSAGGHLCATLGTKWNDPLLYSFFSDSRENPSWRPDGMILCYPVIDMGKYTHEESRYNLLGERMELAESLSLQNCVSKNTVPAFIWCTFADSMVPAENSLLIALAMKEYGIPFELHIYEKGEHGLALCDEQTLDLPEQIQPDNANWLQMSVNWIKRM